MANRLYDFIEHLLQSPDHRIEFLMQPEAVMNARGLTDRSKQMTLFTMDRALICQYLLDEERVEVGNPHSEADYLALVERIVDKYSGYDFDDDVFPSPFYGASVRLMAAAAWSDPDPRITGVSPMSDAQAAGSRIEIQVMGEGLHHEARWVMLVERSPARGVAPHRIKADFRGVVDSQSYRSRTLRAEIDLAGAPRGAYYVLAFNDPWWSLRPTVRFDITRSW